MTKLYTKMLITTRLTGVTFHGRQELLAQLRKQGDQVSHKLRHHNNYQGYDGIAIFQGQIDLGWIPKEISAGLLLPEITASTIQIDNIELVDIIGGTTDKEHYGAEIAMFLSGDAHTLDILAESINSIQRKATEAVVMGIQMNNATELKDSRVDTVKQTHIDDDHKLFIVGESQLRANDIRKVLMEYGIKSGQYKIDNDYYALKNKDEVSSRFKYIFFGATPHSGRGMGDENSIIAHYQKLPNLVVKEIRNNQGQLKLTTDGLRNTLDELVII